MDLYCDVFVFVLIGRYSEITNNEFSSQVVLNES